jgi:glycosyltransferase involved in cell wall biosynthesis
MSHRPLVVVNLAASPFVGGPERQLLGLARHLPEAFRSIFLSFSERGLARPFLDQARRDGFEAIELRHNVPNYRQAIDEIVQHLRRVRADVLCCHGFKPDVFGWRAARIARIPIVAVSHGWTGVTWRVRMYEGLDRLVLRCMDRVVGVSAAQAERVRRAGVAFERVVVIRNAVEPAAFAAPDPTYAQRLRDLFPSPPRQIVGAAGRLSPEKGFDQLIEAAGLICRERSDIGFVIFGDGPLRESLTRQIATNGLEKQVILAGFHNDVTRFLPHLDAVVLPSFTEGLPVVLLEAFAAGVPAVATAVGGTPEVLEEGQSGYLVPAGDTALLAGRIHELMSDDKRRRDMGLHGQRRVQAEFTFATQSEHYQRLFRSLVQRSRSPRHEYAGV